MEKMKKLTKKDYFNRLLEISEVQNDEILVEFINHELKLLEKKKGTLTATQKLNIDLRNDIVKHLREVKEPKAISELQEEIPSLSGFNGQKISALLTPLVNEGIILRRKEHKLTLFVINEE